MAEPTTEQPILSLVEIYPPKPITRLARKPPELQKCICCQQDRPRQFMDEDGCGICEECLRP